MQMPGLLGTCKKICEVAMGIYFGKNTFQAIIDDEESYMVPVNFINSLSPTARKALRELVIKAHNGQQTLDDLDDLAAHHNESNAILNVLLGSPHVTKTWDIAVYVRVPRLTGGTLEARLTKHLTSPTLSGNVLDHYIELDGWTRLLNSLDKLPTDFDTEKLKVTVAKMPRTTMGDGEILRKGRDSRLGFALRVCIAILGKGGDEAREVLGKWEHIALK
jgi:hypothetical protein